MPDVEIDFDGPLFRGMEANAIVKDFLDDARNEISGQAYAEVMTFLNQDIKRPTPYYETQVTRTRQANGNGSVHDRGVKYGPWLEGTDSRNRPRPGFPGYAAFSRAAVAVQARVDEIIAPALRRALARLGGGA